jgi:hypothetical protein
MRPYSYAVAEPVVNLLSVVSRRERESLLTAFGALANDPFQRGDYFIRTTGERDVQVKRFGKWLITFWTDHGNCEVRIIEIKSLLR